MKSARSTIGDATRAYEGWLRRHVRVVEPDLRRKHDLMRASVLAFFRATYYRWAQRWPERCPDLLDAHAVTAVGDLHVENFGTWRDLEGRLAWGVNDFDEASPLPWPNDLVRLASSAALASREGRFRLTAKEICAALLAGYAGSLREGGRPIVLAENHRKLGDHVVQALLDPKSFWTDKVGARLRAKPAPPEDCREVLERALPATARNMTVHARIAGMGSLGRPRFVALAVWEGGHVAREAKQFVPSASVWAGTQAAPSPPEAFVTQLLAGAIRSRDPYLRVSSGWITRRLAPDSDKMRLTSLGRALELELVTLMGNEVANVHLVTPGAGPRVLEDLARLKRGWLRKAARRMVADTLEDYAAWRAR